MEGIQKFIHERYGFDGLACGLVFLSLIINLVTFLVPVPALHRWNFLCFVPLVICVLRMFSRSTEKRSRENERFLRIFASFFSLFDKEEQENESGRQSTINESRAAKGSRQSTVNESRAAEGSRQSTVNESRAAEDSRQNSVKESRAAEDRQSTADESRTASRNSDTSYRRGGRVDKKEQAQLFRFFKCPACSQRIRVPRGKGKVEITCPKCGNRFIKKT